MFKELYNAIPENGTLRLTMVRKNGKLVLTALPTFPIEEVTIPGDTTHGMKDAIKLNDLKPLVMSGTPEEFEEGFINALSEYAPAVEGFQSNISEAKATFDAKLADMKAKEEEKKNKGKKQTLTTPLPPINRNVGEIDEVKANTLATIPATDAAYKSTLKNANVATLEAALGSDISITNAKAVAGELARIDESKTVATILTPLWIERFKGAENGMKANIGKDLVHISGKSLEDLGLAPKPLSLLS